MSESEDVDCIVKIQEAVSKGEPLSLNSESVGEVVVKEGDLSDSGCCKRAFYEIVGSEEFRGLRELVFRGFGGFEVERLEDYRVIDERVKEGGYDRKLSLFASDLEKFSKKMQKLGADIATLARSLSNKTESSYQQYFNQDGCQHCKEKVVVTESIVCDACEGIFHLNCIQPALKRIPPDWDCDKCLSARVGSMFKQ